MWLLSRGARALLNSSIRLSAAGPVGPRTAWRRYELLRLWPHWAPQLQAVECGVDRLTTGA